MSVSNIVYEIKLPKFFMIEDRNEVIPFLIKVRGIPLSKTAYVYFVGLDLSWSMEGESVFIAKRIATDAIRLLGPSSYVNVYGFCRKVSKIVDMTSVKDFDRIAKAISSARPGGGTNIYAFLEHVYRDCRAVEEELVKKGNGGSVRSILMFVSDGFPTAGVKKHGKIVEMAKKVGECVSTSMVFGVGEKVNHRLLEDIAINTHGVYTHLVELSGLPATIEKTVSRLRDVVASNVRLIVKTQHGVGVHVYNRYAYVSEWGVEIEVGDVHGDEEIDVVGEFIVPPQRRGTVLLGTVQGVYKVGTGEQKVQIMPATNITIPCISASAVPSNATAINDATYKEINAIRIATALAKDMYGSISVERLKHVLEKLISTTIVVEAKDLYAKTIDLRSELEKEGLPPQTVDKIIALLYKVLTGKS